MNSLDFLSPREVVEDCVRLAAISSLAVVAVGCVVWALLAAFGKSSDREPAFALVWPFFISAIYGNAVIYNIRWRHGIKVFGGSWWVLLTGLAIAWTVGFMAMGLGIEFLLVALGVLARAQRPLQDAVQWLLGAAVFAVVFSLLPAKQQYIT